MQVNAQVNAQINAQINARAEETPIAPAPRSRSGWVARGPAAVPPEKLRPVERPAHSDVCPVCTCDEVRFDEVEFGPRMKLAECPRCEHRWTTPVATTRLARARSLPAERRLAVVPGASVGRAARA